MSQRDTVLRLLQEAGKKGVSARTLIYEHGITRGATIIFDLREEGMNIETVDEPQLADGRKRLARYILHGAEKRTERPVTIPAEDIYSRPDPAPALSLPCGCVRASDGKSWAQRCATHDTGPTVTSPSTADVSW